MLIYKKVSKHLKEFHAIKGLKSKEFPHDEKYTVGAMLLASKLRKPVRFLAIYDDKTFIGFIFFVYTQAIVNILYLAIDESHQSKGYGGKVLEHIKEEFHDKNILLYIEPQDGNLSNLRRKVFYERHGFCKTQYILNENNIPYELYSLSGDADLTEFRKTYKILSFGFYKPEIDKKKST